jgi:hypothetical protein
VNKKAFEQYSNFTKQREQLRKRREDLEASAKSIHALMATLDQRKDEAIERTFKQVSKYFEEVFEKLVPAGRGRLIMQKNIDDVRISLPLTNLERRLTFLFRHRMQRWTTMKLDLWIDILGSLSRSLSIPKSMKVFVSSNCLEARSRWSLSPLVRLPGLVTKGANLFQSLLFKSVTPRHSTFSTRLMRILTRNIGQLLQVSRFVQDAIRF